MVWLAVLEHVIYIFSKLNIPFYLGAAVKKIDLALLQTMKFSKISFSSMPDSKLYFHKLSKDHIAHCTIYLHVLTNIIISTKYHSLNVCYDHLLHI